MLCNLYLKAEVHLAWFGTRVGDSSRNFIVGLTDVSPTVKTPTLWDYDVCGQWPGEVGRGATVHLKCQQPGIRE